MRYLRYLRRPAARRIDSFETEGRPSSVSLSSTLATNCLSGRVTRSGGPAGHNASMARFARSTAGRPLLAGRLDDPAAMAGFWVAPKAVIRTGRESSIDLTSHQP